MKLTKRELIDRLMKGEKLSPSGREGYCYYDELYNNPFRFTLPSITIPHSEPMSKTWSYTEWEIYEPPIPNGTLVYAWDEKTLYQNASFRIGIYCGKRSDGKHLINSNGYVWDNAQPIDIETIQEPLKSKLLKMQQEYKEKNK